MLQHLLNTMLHVESTWLLGHSVNVACCVNRENFAQQAALVRQDARGARHDGVFRVLQPRRADGGVGQLRHDGAAVAGCVRYCRPLTSTLMWAQRIAREDLGCKAAAPPPLSTTCGAERRERSMRLARGYGSVSVSHSRSRCQHWCASIERAHRERQREEPKQCGRCSMSAADATGCGASPVSSAFAPLSSPPPLDERARVLRGGCVLRGDCVCARRGDHTSRSAPRRHVAALLAPRHPPHPSQTAMAERRHTRFAGFCRPLQRAGAAPAVVHWIAGSGWAPQAAVRLGAPAPCKSLQKRPARAEGRLRSGPFGSSVLQTFAGRCSARGARQLWYIGLRAAAVRLKQQSGGAPPRAAKACKNAPRARRGA